MITEYDKKGTKLAEIAHLEKKVGNIRILKGRGMTNAVQKKELLISKKSSELATIVEQIKKIRDPFSLDDIVIYIQRKFGHYIKKSSKPIVRKSDEIITSEKIRSKIRRGISIWVHRNEEIKKIRFNAWYMIRMAKMYEKIIDDYTKKSAKIDDPQKKREIASALREELDRWEKDSNILIDQFSLSYIRQLRDQIIEELLSKK